MFKMKKIAAIAAAAVMAVSAMAVSVGAYSTSYKTRNYSDTISATQSNGYKSVLSVYYMYGASSTGKADLICNYGYGDQYGYGYKYATIAYGEHSVGAGKDDCVTGTMVKTTTDIITPNSSANSSITYGGYCKASPDSATSEYDLTYILKLTV